MSEFENSVILLISNEPDKNPAFGSAFMVAHDNAFSYLLTCAHVIEQINKDSTANQLKLLGVDHPVDIVCCGASDGIDIALLKVKDLIDKPVFTLFNKGNEGDAIKITGYSGFNTKTGQHLRRPLNGKLGKSIMLASKTEDKQFPAWDVLIEDNELATLESGYSGSPLYTSTGELIAVVSHRRSGDKGHAFCISNLKTLYPKISQLIPAIERLTQSSRVKKIRTKLFQRMGEISTIYNILGKCLAHMAKQGIDSDAEIILEMCDAFIANEMDSQNFIAYCQTLVTDSVTIQTNKPNYDALAQRLNEGEVALCIGSELAPSLDSNLKSVNELTHQISTLARFENINHQALAEICEYAEIHTDCTRQKVIVALKNLLTPPTGHIPKITLYDLLASLQQPVFVISNSFDTLLEQRLSKSGKQFVSIVANHNVESTAKERFFLNISDKENHSCSDEQLSTLQFMERGYSLIYHPRGYSDDAQDTLLLSERDYFNAADLLNKRYPAYLHNHLKSRGLWFLGYHPESWETRLLAKVLQYQRRNNRDQPLVIHQQASDFSKFFWRDIQCQHYNDVSLNEFINGIEHYCNE
jgi:hypothetical protein